jgi:hypothetical protein
MKNISNIFKTILAILTAVIGAGFFCTPSALAFDDKLTVDTWDTTVGDHGDYVPFNSRPLFKVDNFYPGEDVVSRIRVCNRNDNGSGNKRIATEALNYPGFPNKDAIPAGDLSRYLSIAIKEKNGSDIYEGSLYNFYRNGETYLSTIPAGECKEYEYAVEFPSTEENGQGATTTFKLLVGFQGEEGGVVTPGGGSGSAPLGLTIPDESVVSTAVNENSVTITWTTSYPATSWVIYSAEGEDPHTLNINEPLHYGYAHSTVEDPYKTQTHSVIIKDLVPGTTYHYRCVSHGSLAVSLDYTFTTAKREETVQNSSEKNENLGPLDVDQGENSVQGSGPLAANSFVPQVSGTSTEIENSEQSGQTDQTNKNDQEQLDQQNGQDQASNEKISNNPFNPNNLAASISNFLNFQNAKDFWLAWFLIAFFFAMFFVWSRRKRKKGEQSKK